MNSEPKAKRLAGKTRLHGIQVELQQGYNLSPVEAQVLARRVQQLVAQRSFVEQHGIKEDVEKINANANQYTNPDEGITRHRRNC